MYSINISDIKICMFWVSIFEYHLRENHDALRNWLFSYPYGLRGNINSLDSVETWYDNISFFTLLLLESLQKQEILTVWIIPIIPHGSSLRSGRWWIESVVLWHQNRDEEDTRKLDQLCLRKTEHAQSFCFILLYSTSEWCFYVLSGFTFSLLLRNDAWRTESLSFIPEECCLCLQCT